VGAIVLWTGLGCGAVAGLGLYGNGGAGFSVAGAEAWAVVGVLGYVLHGEGFRTGGRAGEFLSPARAACSS
jgi:hypothetical protein